MFCRKTTGIQSGVAASGNKSSNGISNNTGRCGDVMQFQFSSRR